MQMITMAEAIRRTQDKILQDNPKAVLLGLGAPDGMFGTTKGLSENYPNRVYDVPCSEEALMGIALGMSLNGGFPIITHQRADFLLTCMNQIVNNVAKWSTVYNHPTPMLIRAVIGRGWGQGCNHGQDLIWMFQQIQGLVTLCPSSPADAWSMLQWAAGQDKPVLFFEHRWLHSRKGPVYDIPFVMPDLSKKTFDIPSFAAYGYAYHMAVKAAELLWEQDKTYVPVLDTKGSYLAPTKNLCLVYEQKPGSFLPAGPNQGAHYNTPERIANDMLRIMGEPEVFDECPASDQCPALGEWL